METGWGLDLILWFQSWRGPVMDIFAEVFNWLGREDFFMLLVPFIYWCIDALLGKRLFFMLVFSIWTNAAVKSLLQRPRPFMVDDRVDPVFEEASYGIPSGHAQNATAITAPVAYHVRKQWFTILMIVYVVLVCISRLVAGVHFLQDVVVGVLIGLILFGLYLVLEPRITGWLRGVGVGAELAAAIIIPLIMYLIHPILIAAPNLESREGAVAAVGVMMGGIVGFVLDERYLRFSAAGEEWKRAVRLVIGLAVILGIRFGLGAAFEGLEPVDLFRIIRYVLIGLWAGYGAPWVFVKLGLAGVREKIADSSAKP